MFKVVLYSILCSLAAASLSEDEKKVILKAHNNARRNVFPTASNMLEMRWSESIALIAQEYSDRCVFQHSFSKLGENLLFSQSFNAINAVSHWEKEKLFYTYADSASTSETGHYTQIIWADSFELGCGLALCNDSRFGDIFLFVCNYRPAGNYQGETPYLAGEQCSSCPTPEHFCSRGLCSKQECHIRLNSIQINITEGTKSDFTVHMAYDFNCTNIQTVENEIHLHVSLYCPGNDTGLTYCLQNDKHFLLITTDKINGRVDINGKLAYIENNIVSRVKNKVIQCKLNVSGSIIHDQVEMGLKITRIGRIEVQIVDNDELYVSFKTKELVILEQEDKVNISVQIKLEENYTFEDFIVFVSCVEEKAFNSDNLLDDFLLNKINDTPEATSFCSGIIYPVNFQFNSTELEQNSTVDKDQNTWSNSFLFDVADYSFNNQLQIQQVFPRSFDCSIQSTNQGSNHQKGENDTIKIIIASEEDFNVQFSENIVFAGKEFGTVQIGLKTTIPLERIHFSVFVECDVKRNESTDFEVRFWNLPVEYIILYITNENLTQFECSIISISENLKIGSKPRSSVKVILLQLDRISAFFEPEEITANGSETVNISLSRPPAADLYLIMFKVCVVCAISENFNPSISSSNFTNLEDKMCFEFSKEARISIPWKLKLSASESTESHITTYLCHIDDNVTTNVVIQGFDGKLTNNTSKLTINIITKGLDIPKTLSSEETLLLPLVTTLSIVLLSCLVLSLGIAIFACRKKLRSKREGIHYSKARRYTMEMLSLIERDEEWEIPLANLAFIKNLGSGNFGEVQLAYLSPDIMNERAKNYIEKTKYRNPYIPPNLVAVKRLKGMTSIENQMSFVGEMSVMKKASNGDCPHVVNILGCMTTSSPFCIVMEYVSFGDLKSFLRKLRDEEKPVKSCTNEKVVQENLAINEEELCQYNMYIPWATASGVTEQDRAPDTDDYYKVITMDTNDLFSFAYQITCGMQHLSSLGIVHRDLACRNILVDCGKVLKVSDFGLSREIEDYYSSKSLTRMPLRWMAPESILHQKYSEKSDVWSFGICLWEICTLGALPYPGITNEDLFRLLETGYQMRKPKGCSDDGYADMKWCWKCEPSERPTFLELKSHYEHIIEAQQEGNYLDMNVTIPKTSNDGVSRPVTD